MVTVTEMKFSDIYFTTENNKAYIPDRRTLNALMEFNAEDLDIFYMHLLHHQDQVVYKNLQV